MKFENSLAEKLYDLSLDGGADDEIGSVGELGWFGKFDLAILAEDSQGFVEVYTFDNTAEFKAEWKNIEDCYSEFWQSQDDSNGGQI